MTSSILTKINSTNHSILSTKRRNSSSTLITALTFKPTYGMLGNIDLCCNLQCMKVCCRFFSWFTIICSLNCDFLHAQRFWNDLLKPLLALLWFLCFRIWGLEIHWGNVFNAVLQTRFTDIFSCRLTKNLSHIVSGTFILSCSSYSRNDKQFKLDVESPSLPDKNTELFYCLVTHLLFTSKVARPDIQACVTYIFTRMKNTNKLSQR